MVGKTLSPRAWYGAFNEQGQLKLDKVLKRIRRGVLTTVFNHITYGLPPFTLKAPIKVSGDYWGKNSGELELIVKDNELVCGVIDKAQFGKYGIVHTFQELYGPEMAGHLLSVFSRLFTGYLQVLAGSLSLSRSIF